LTIFTHSFVYNDPDPTFSDFFSDKRAEPAFLLLNFVVHKLGLEFVYVNVISAGLFFIGFHALAKRQPDPLGVLILAFPILILNLPMSGLRQGIAVGFVCLAYNAFVSRSVSIFAFFVTIAALFHNSAMIFFALAPFVRGEFSRRRVALGALLAAPAAYYIVTGSPTFQMYASRYVGTATEAAGAVYRAGTLALTGIVFLWLLDRKWKAKSILDYKLVKIFSYLMIVTFLLSFVSSVAADRIGYYFMPVQLMILARMPVLVESRYSYVAASAPYAVGLLLLLIWTQLSTLFERCYVPYQVWW
jgi:hypothetical protein